MKLYSTSILHHSTNYSPPIAIDGYGSIQVANELHWFRDELSRYYFRCTSEHGIVWQTQIIEATEHLDTWPMVSFWSKRVWDEVQLGINIRIYAPCIVYVGVGAHQLRDASV